MLVERAEGVESHEAWRRLAELGCDLAQGFYVSRPLPADAMTRLLGERRSALAEQDLQSEPEPVVPEPVVPFRVVGGYAS